MRDTLTQYFRDIKKLLPCSTAEKKRCILELEADVSAFLENNPDATPKDLYAAIGSPQSIAESFMARTDPEQLSRTLSVKRKIAIGVITITAILAMIVVIVAIKIANDIHDFQNGYAIEVIEETSSFFTESPVPLEIH